MAFVFNILVLITSSHNLTFNNGCLHQPESQKMEGSALAGTRAHASTLLLSDRLQQFLLQRGEGSGRRARPALATSQPMEAAAQEQAWLTWGGWGPAALPAALLPARRPPGPKLGSFAPFNFESRDSEAQRRKFVAACWGGSLMIQV